jgi:hypothetical protein
MSTIRPRFGAAASTLLDLAQEITAESPALAMKHSPGGYSA